MKDAFGAGDIQNLQILSEDQRWGGQAAEDLAAVREEKEDEEEEEEFDESDDESDGKNLKRKKKSKKKKKTGDEEDTDDDSVDPISSVTFSKQTQIENDEYKNVSKGVKLLFGMLLEDVTRKRKKAAESIPDDKRRKTAVKKIPTLPERKAMIKKMYTELRKSSFDHLATFSDQGTKMPLHQVPVDNLALGSAKTLRCLWRANRTFGYEIKPYASPGQSSAQTAVSAGTTTFVEKEGGKQKKAKTEKEAMWVCGTVNREGVWDWDAVAPGEKEDTGEEKGEAKLELGVGKKFGKIQKLKLEKVERKRRRRGGNDNLDEESQDFAVSPVSDLPASRKQKGVYKETGENPEEVQKKIQQTLNVMERDGLEIWGQRNEEWTRMQNFGGILGHEVWQDEEFSRI